MCLENGSVSSVCRWASVELFSDPAAPSVMIRAGFINDLERVTQLHEGVTASSARDYSKTSLLTLKVIGYSHVIHTCPSFSKHLLKVRGLCFTEVGQSWRFEGHGELTMVSAVVLKFSLNVIWVSSYFLRTEALLWWFSSSVQTDMIHLLISPENNPEDAALMNVH